jgi:small subunit ribosomal protein S6
LRRYETIFITDPELPDDDVTGLVASLSATVSDREGEVLQSEDWGRKKLAYDVQKRREGRYLRLEYSAPDGTIPAELERRMRMSEPVIKFLTVRIDNDKKRLVWEVKQAAREQERAARQAAAAAEQEAAAPAADAPAAGDSEAARGEEGADTPKPDSEPKPDPDGSAGKED